jgi:hypothetical protein
MRYDHFCNFFLLTVVSYFKLLVYADIVNLLEDNINTVKEHGNYN